MARFKLGEEEKYGGQGGGGYFSLKNDMDVATVRFMYDSSDDIEGYPVHEVTINDKKRWVECLREYNAPIDDCPFCKAGRFVSAKYFIQLYNVDEDKVQTWERGKQFGAKLSGLFARYPHIVGHKFEIERHGKAGSMETKYEIYPVGDSDDVNVADLPEATPIRGSVVLVKTAEEMNYYLNNDVFPIDDEVPFTRGSERREERRDERRSSDDGVQRRRTPAGNRESF